MDKPHRVLMGVGVAVVVIALGVWRNSFPDEALSMTWDKARDSREPNPEIPVVFSTGGESVPVIGESGEVAQFSGVIVGRLDEVQGPLVSIQWNGRAASVERAKLRLADPDDAGDRAAWDRVPRPEALSSLFGWSLRSGFWRGDEGEVVVREVDRSEMVLRGSRYVVSQDAVAPWQYVTMSDKSLAFGGLAKWFRILSTAAVAGIVVCLGAGVVWKDAAGKVRTEG